MKASEEHIDLFDKYLNGLLSAMERQHLEERLQSDVEFFQAFSEYRDLVKGIDAVGPVVLKHSFSEIEAGIPASEIQPYQPSGRGKNASRKEKTWNVMTWVMIIGSGVLLIAFIIALFNLPDLEEKMNRSRKKKSGEVETVITEEKEELNCSAIACNLPLQFQEYSDRVARGEASESAQVSYIVCEREDAGEGRIEMVSSTYGDSIYLWNMSCESLELFFMPDESDGVLMLCDSVYYQLNEEGSSVYQERIYEAEVDTVAERGDVESELEQSTSDNQVEKAKVEVTQNDKAFQENVKEQISTSVNGQLVSLDSEKKKSFEPTQDAYYDGDIYQWLSNNMTFPQSSKEQGVSGKVVVSFVTDAKGQVGQIKIVEGLDAACNQEVLRCMNSMPDWVPAKSGDFPVPQSHEMPITFSTKGHSSNR